jgi:hypothetical protein
MSRLSLLLGMSRLSLVVFLRFLLYLRQCLV